MDSMRKIIFGKGEKLLALSIRHAAKHDFNQLVAAGRTDHRGLLVIEMGQSVEAIKKPIAGLSSASPRSASQPKASMIRPSMITLR